MKKYSREVNMIGVEVTLPSKLVDNSRAAERAKW
jgi:hypothetical protein